MTEDNILTPEPSSSSTQPQEETQPSPTLEEAPKETQQEAPETPEEAPETPEQAQEEPAIQEERELKPQELQKQVEMEEKRLRQAMEMEAQEAKEEIQELPSQPSQPPSEEEDSKKDTKDTEEKKPLSEEEKAIIRMKRQTFKALHDFTSDMDLLQAESELLGMASMLAQMFEKKKQSFLVKELLCPELTEKGKKAVELFQDLTLAQALEQLSTLENAINIEKNNRLSPLKVSDLDIKLIDPEQFDLPQ